MPIPGGYWLFPSAIAWIAAWLTSDRTVGIGETLTQVDRPGLDGEGAHLGEDGGAETLQLRAEERLLSWTSRLSRRVAGLEHGPR